MNESVFREEESGRMFPIPLFSFDYKYIYLTQVYNFPNESVAIFEDRVQKYK